MMHTNWCWPVWLKKAPCEYKACNKHDLAYKKGWNKFDRYVADNIFLEEMLIEKPNSQVCAYVYYLLVRLFWKKYFNYK